MAKSNIQTVNVNRVYETRESSRLGQVRIGQVEAVIDVAGFTINGQPVHPAGVEHLLHFAFQSLQDAYAGAENEPDARAAFNGKLERILKGTIGVREAGSGVSALMSAIRTLLRPDVKAAHGAETWKAMLEDARLAAIDAVWEDQDDDTKAAYTAAAQEELDRKRAEAERLAKVKAGLGGLKVKKA